MAKTVIFPGTFDPLTLGHESIIEQAQRLFDRVVVAVAEGHHKTTWLPLETRIEILQEVTGLEVVPLSGLLVDLVRELKADAVIRGLRNSQDLYYEMDMKAINQLQQPIDYVFLMTEGAQSTLSSRLVREVVRLGGRYQSMVSPLVADRLAQL